VAGVADGRPASRRSGGRCRGGAAYATDGRPVPKKGRVALQMGSRRAGGATDGRPVSRRSSGRCRERVARGGAAGARGGLAGGGAAEGGCGGGCASEVAEERPEEGAGGRTAGVEEREDEGAGRERKRPQHID
jgi:hypothetical protein